MGLLVDHVDAGDANVECPPLVVALAYELGYAEDPFKSAPAQAILDQEEAAHLLEATLDVSHVVLVQQLPHVPLRHLSRVWVAVVAHQGQHI